jgi:hypothetical protein
MVYNWRDDTRLGGSTLIGTVPGVCKTAQATLLILTALAVTVIVGCGAGSGGSSQPSGKQQSSGSSGSQAQETEDTGSSGRVSGGREGHPTLGSADAPVVLTEYSDYQ